MRTEVAPEEGVTEREVRVMVVGTHWGTVVVMDADGIQPSATRWAPWNVRIPKPLMPITQETSPSSQSNEIREMNECC